MTHIYGLCAVTITEILSWPPPSQVNRMLLLVSNLWFYIYIKTWRLEIFVKAGFSKRNTPEHTSIMTCSC